MNSKSGTLLGGQILQILGLIAGIIIYIILFAASGSQASLTPGEGAEFVQIIAGIGLAFIVLNFIFLFVGWNKKGFAIASGVMAFFSCILACITVIGIIAGVLLFIGAILSLVGSKSLDA